MHNKIEEETKFIYVREFFYNKSKCPIKGNFSIKMTRL